MKQIFTVFLLISICLGCKKDDEINPVYTGWIYQTSLRSANNYPVQCIIKINVADGSSDTVYFDTYVKETPNSVSSKSLISSSFDIDRAQKRIALLTTEKQGWQVSSNISIYDLATEKLLQQIPIEDLPEGPWDIKFSTDGTQVAVSYGSKFDRPARVYVYKLTETTPYRVFNGYNEFEWLPDGRILLYLNNYQIDGLEVGDPATGNTSRFLTFNLFNGRWKIDISPDGQKILFSDRDIDKNLWIMNIDGTGLTQITDSDYSLYKAQWSSDGKYIMFAVSGQYKFVHYPITASHNATLAIPADGKMYSIKSSKNEAIEFYMWFAEKSEIEMSAPQYWIR
ncbi:hypothetical protein [Xanthocytophaga flava]|uniref:hypothetical protein n=1 Tax=Xanthocytophaga flava TaxID=3048013 RepID=UPI0028CFEB6B|nr:hypothetical protein [Xanthocytophaga flavus]MDJ1471870.1 hypothetical protein [Xanthocytophaga flavus]